MTDIVDEDPESVTVRATITTSKGAFSGHARSKKNASSVEGESPLEVAETSAVGRALAFAGYGSHESISSADEMPKAPRVENVQPAEEAQEGAPECACGVPRTWRTGTSKAGPWRGWFCPRRPKCSEPEFLEDEPGAPPSEPDRDGADWSGLWVQASELNLSKDEVHKLFGVPPHTNALKNYAEVRAIQGKVPLQAVVDSMRGELGQKAGAR